MAVQTVAWNSGAPNIDFSAGACHKLTLKGDYPALTVTNPTAGSELIVIIAQDSTGGRRFKWPSTFKGAGDVSGLLAPGQTAVARFVYDGASWRASSPVMFADS